MGSSITHIDVQWCTVPPPPKCGTWQINQWIHTYIPQTKRAFTCMCLHICVTSQCPKNKMLKNSARLWIRFIQTLTNLTWWGPNTMRWIWDNFWRSSKFYWNFEDFGDNHMLLHYVWTPLCQVVFMNLLQSWAVWLFWHFLYIAHNRQFGPVEAMGGGWNLA